MGEPQKLYEMMGRLNLMTPRQREIVERDRKNLQQSLEGRPMPLYGGDPQNEYRPSMGGASPSGTVMVLRDTPMPDVELLRRNYQECNRTLEMGTAPDLSSAAKNTLYRWWKEELAIYQEGMPSHEQMWRPSWQNLQLYQRHKERNARRAKRLANIHRALDASDEGFHLEGFRPEKPTPFNGKAFREGWEGIAWDDATDLELQANELDDETYYRYVELKAQGVTEPKIYEQKLGITSTLRKACEVRLQRAVEAYTITQVAEAAQQERGASHDERLTLDESLTLLTEEAPSREGVVALTEAESKALEQYGDAVIAVACEKPVLTADDLKEILDPLIPPGGKGAQRYQVVEATARALTKTGLLVQDGPKHYRVKDAVMP